MSLISIDQVAALLAGRIDALAPELLAGGKRKGREWRAGSLAGEAGQSLGVHLTGAKAGVWCDFASGETGDALDLVAQVLFRGDKSEALKWSRRWLGLEDGDPAAMATARRQAEQRRAVADKQAAEDEERRRRGALAMWLEARPIEGTPAEAYLRGRGIDLRALGHVPAALRFHPALYCREADMKLPAMVAAIGAPDGRHVATHRTFLAPVAGSWASPLPPHQAGQWGKAKLREAKLTYGTYAGGFIRLTRGASQRAWREMRGDETVAFAEGIETALSVAVLVPEWRVAASVSLSNLKRVQLPPTVRRLVVCADRDPPDSRATEALAQALRALPAQGAEVFVVRPDHPFKDWNDQLQAELADRCDALASHVATGAREASA
jgi:hypothetical protein